MQALRSEILPPSGVQFACSLKLLPCLVSRNRPGLDGTNRKALCNVVVAYSHLLRIYELVEEPIPIQVLASQGATRDGWSRVKKDTDAVEGEVEMDTQGEGFVNMGAVKVALHPFRYRSASMLSSQIINMLTRPFSSLPQAQKASPRQYSDSISSVNIVCMGS